MSRNATTRPKGNGSGWGGPANGGGDRPEPETGPIGSNPYRKLSNAEREARAVEREAKANDLLERVYSIGLAIPEQAVPAAMAYHRLAGLMPADKQQITGADEGPIQIDDVRLRIASKLGRMSDAASKG